MKWAAILSVLVLMIATTFCFLDAGTALMASFAIVAVAFFGSLPWAIMRGLDRRKPRADISRARIVRGFDHERSD